MPNGVEEQYMAAGRERDRMRRSLLD